MGIYGALSTAVSGLNAESFALQNISGNIANSQTIAYKRTETSFTDMIPDTPASKQTAGSVSAQSHSTNDVQGDISSSTVPTNMAISGSGFFVVQQKTGESDGNATFSGATLFTRRGDFEKDKDGYLVNGSGNYLEGLPIDQTTGNVSGSVPGVIKLSNDVLPAKPTTAISYQLNLPQLPTDAAYVEGTPGSELLQAPDYLPAPPPDTPAMLTGASSVDGTTTAADANATPAATVMPAGTSLTINVGGTPTTFDFYDSTVGAYAGGNVGIDVASGQTVGNALSAIQTGLQAAGASTADAQVGVTANGAVQIGLGSNLSDTLSVSANTTNLDLPTTTANATGPAASGPVDTISGAQGDDFLAQSTSGGAVTVYGAIGTPVNVQLRWAKTGSAATGGTDSWSLYYMSNSAATGSQTMWTKVPQDYNFSADGSLNPPVTSTTIPNLTVNGVNAGNIVLNHGSSGVTQFADPNGTAAVTGLTQNGYPAGTYTSVAVNDSGRIVESYSNGQQIEVAQVVTASFNSPNSLKSLNGGTYQETSESGGPILSSTGDNIAAASLEASNTDISTEFTKLIVTQQAYAAATKIVSTSNSMLQQTLNMIQ